MSKDCTEEPQPKKSIDEDVLTRFAESLLARVKKSRRKEWFEKLGIDYACYRKSNISFWLWQRASLALTYKKLIGDCEFIEFSDESLGTPTYVVIEYKRETSDSLPVEGYSWIQIENKNIVLEIDYASSSCWIYAYYNPEDQDLVKELFDEIKTEVNAMNFLRGEKLLVTSGNHTDFFKFKHTTKKDLVLPDAVWASLEKNLFLYINKEEEIKKNDLEWKRGILIWGPPGTGKTLLGKYLCSNLPETTVLWITPKCVGDAGDIKKLFEVARTLSPTIIFIEDLDFFAANRDIHGLHPILGELLTQLDGISTNDGVFVIGTTNNQHALDRAIACRPSRFDVRLEVGLPVQQEREKLFRLFLGNRPIDKYSLLSTRSNGFSAAHIKEACVRGVLSILCDGSDLEKCVLASIDEIREEELNRPPPTGQIS